MEGEKRAQVPRRHPRAKERAAAVRRGRVKRKSAAHAQERAINSQYVPGATIRIIAPHARALHARRPLIAVLEEVGRLRAVRRLRARTHHRDGEERREGVEQSPCHRCIRARNS